MPQPVNHRETVLPEWVDYNGHMNVAYYVLIFDHATDAFLEELGIDETYRNETNGSVFVVESHIVYENEVMQGAEVEVSTRLLNADHKRLHLLHTMTVAGDPTRVATIELMILHIDLKRRKSAPFEAGVADRVKRTLGDHASLGKAVNVGRQIRFDAKI